MSLIETTFLCGLEQVTLPMTTKRGEQFSDGYFLTRDQDLIANLVSKFGNSLGSVEAGYLARSASAVVYRHGSMECEVSSADQVSNSLAKQLIDDMLALKGLESALWLLKDNACHFDRAWIAGTINGRTIVNNNVWASRHSCADGSFRNVSFSSDELRTARGLRRPLGMHLKGEDAPTALERGSLRFQRFEYFVQAARGTIDVAVKIAQYCSGLEALVSTAQQELSHQVSERVAAALVGAGVKRVEIYKLVKKAYGFRSKTVHGASFKPADASLLRECSKGVDEICRALQSLYFDEDPAFRTAVEGSDERLSDFFLDAILACRPMQDRVDMERSA